MVRVELPGLDPSQVRVTCDGGILTIAGTREEIREHEEIDFPLRERTFGSFSRSIRLPAEADDGDVRTTFANGLLVVRVGKRSLGSGIGGVDPSFVLLSCPGTRCQQTRRALPSLPSA